MSLDVHGDDEVRHAYERMCAAARRGHAARGRAGDGARGRRVPGGHLPPPGARRRAHASAPAARRPSGSPRRRMQILPLTDADAERLIDASRAGPAGRRAGRRGPRRRWSTCCAGWLRSPTRSPRSWPSASTRCSWSTARPPSPTSASPWCRTCPTPALRSAASDCTCEDETVREIRVGTPSISVTTWSSRGPRNPTWACAGRRRSASRSPPGSTCRRAGGAALDGRPPVPPPAVGAAAALPGDAPGRARRRGGGDLAAADRCRASSRTTDRPPATRGRGPRWGESRRRGGSRSSRTVRPSRRSMPTRWFRVRRPPAGRLRVQRRQGQPPPARAPRRAGLPAHGGGGYVAAAGPGRPDLGPPVPGASPRSPSACPSSWSR